MSAPVYTNPPPPLFVAINAGCNLTCWYCTEHGENRSFGGRLPFAKLMQILERAYVRGVRTFRITGGEPTARRDVGTILLAIQELGDDVRIALTTNGARLEGLVEVFRQLREPRLFVSVDGVDPELPREGEPPGSFRIEKWLTPSLAEVIDSLIPFSHVRLNYVLTRSSQPQLPTLIDYAVDREIDVKIFELLLRDFFYTGHRPPLEVFREQYLSVAGVIPMLHERYGEPRPFAGTGGRGIPMRAFDTGSSRVIYFDSAEGSHYGETCLTCAHYPCQEGLYALVLDTNGTLHPAGCVNPLLHARLVDADVSTVDEAFGRLQAAIDTSTLQPVVPGILLSMLQAT